MVAKRLREKFPVLAYPDSTQLLRTKYFTKANVITDLALSFAQTFAEDNVNFDPLKFLDQCSPDPDRLPLSELWEDYLQRG